MIVPDLNFHSKYLISYIFINKFLLINSLMLPFINSSTLGLFVTNSSDLNDVSLVNYIYVLRFYFGKRAFLYNHSVVFKLNVSYHEFLLELNLVVKDTTLVYNFLVYETLPFLNRKYLKLFFDSNSLIITIMDPSIFAEKQLTMGIFNMKYNLDCKFYFSNVSDDPDTYLKFYQSVLKLR